MTTESLEDTVRSLYIDNYFDEILLMKEAITAYCISTPESANNLISLFINCRRKFLQVNHDNGEIQMVVFQDFLFFMENIPIQNFPSKVIFDL